MANKTRAIEDSKRKRDFKQRNKGRQERSAKKDKFEKSKYVQRGSQQHKHETNKRQKKEEASEGSDDEETKYNNVMAEEDPELERELKEAGLIEGDAGSEDLDEQEFLEHADELDIPDEEGDDEDDLKGEDTDSDLEDYYRELGIENEEDEVAAVAVKTKPKKAAKKGPSKLAQAHPQVSSKEELRRKIIDNLMEKTRTGPTYANLTRVIKIIKQVFFAGSGSSAEEGDDEEGKKQQKKDKTQAIAAILLQNSGEYKRLLVFFC